MSASPLRTVLTVRQVAEDAVNKAASRLGHNVPASVTVREVSGIPAPEIIHASGDHHAACPVVTVRS